MNCAAERVGLDLLRQDRPETRPLAQAQIEDGRIGVGRDRRVPRRAERVIGEVGEDPVGRVLRIRLADMTGDAIALLRVGEELEPARLDRREPGLPAQVIVEPGGEGGEPLGRLVGVEGGGQIGHGGLRIGEGVRSEDGLDEVGVGTGLHLVDHGFDGRIVHLDRIEHGDRGLLGEIGSPAVPELPALGLQRFLAVVDVLVEAEGGAVGLVHDCRNLAPPELVRRAAGGDARNGRAVVALKGVLRRMARGAGLAARLRQVRILEHALAEKLRVGQTLLVVRSDQGRGGLRLSRRAELRAAQEVRR